MKCPENVWLTLTPHYVVRVGQSEVARGLYQPVQAYKFYPPALSPSSQLAHIGEPYFRVEFDEGASLFAKIKGRFPLQFGRYAFNKQQLHLVIIPAACHAAVVVVNPLYFLGTQFIVVRVTL